MRLNAFLSHSALEWLLFLYVPFIVFIAVYLERFVDYILCQIYVMLSLSHSLWRCSFARDSIYIEYKIDISTLLCNIQAHIFFYLLTFRCLHNLLFVCSFVLFWSVCCTLEFQHLHTFSFIQFVAVKERTFNPKNCAISIQWEGKTIYPYWCCCCRCRCHRCYF